MYKLYISIKKELLLLLNDRVGLLLMFAMPLLLVIIITIIQDSAFKIVNNKAIKLLVSNADTGDKGAKMVMLLEQTNMFDIIEDNTLDSAQLKTEISHKTALTALFIGSNFSTLLDLHATQLSTNVLRDFGLVVDSISNIDTYLPELLFFHDPVLQESYCFSIMNVLYAHLKNIESQQMVESFYVQMGFDGAPEHVLGADKNTEMPIKRISATVSGRNKIPDSTQHNVPAWTVFAMFFMVVSLGSNIVKERTIGSFLRLKTMPTSFALVLSSKQFVYIGVAVLQVVLIFSVGLALFPSIGLPTLVMPTNIGGLVAVTLMSGLSAVSYALLIGTLTKTHEQANGAGAVSIIIFAALGGVWVPTFAMPEYLQIISTISPLHWCLEGYYVLFLKDGNWMELYPILLVLFAFIAVCQGISYLKLKLEKLI